MTRNRYVRSCLYLLALALVSTPLWARSPEVNPGMWIIELHDEPTAVFRGGVPNSVVTAASADGASSKAMAATSPAVTGAKRLDTEASQVKAYVGHLDQERNRVLDAAADTLGRALEPRFVYRHLRNGFAAKMSSDEAKRLRKLPGVRSVTPDYIDRISTDQGPQWINAPEMWSGSTGAPNPNRGEGTVLGVIDTGVNWESTFFNLEFSSFPVDNPRDGFYGLCNDETLNIPCSDKLIGVYDFTDEGTNGFDPDTHGSHVASTAVGLQLGFTLTNFGPVPISFETSGVAPRASFISYKACQADPEEPAGNFSCPNSATAASLEQAIEDGVDAVNFSIGGDPFDPWSTAGNQRVFLNMRTAGIVPITSAGNSGPNDFTVGSPANVPWIAAVANASHGRFFGTSLENTSGGSSFLLPLTGRARDSEGTGSVLPIVYAGDFGNALCGTGEAELQASCDSNTGSSNPFPAGTFNGEIVVCDRGTYGRVEKGKNLQLAGAGGIILANTQSAGGEATESDQHCLPAMHIGADDGDKLRDWLASGSDHEGQLTPTSRVVDSREAGLLANSSARGPSFGAPGVMKPNVTAPGSDILAAGTQTDDAGTGPGENAANQIGILSGTSMSSPHVAGAALLLRAAHPDWGVSEVLSALETTANPLIVRNGDRSVARIIDRGAGGIQVDQAARIGLFLPVTEAEFLDANPNAGGDPSELNLPGIVSDNCADACVFTRTVEALDAGSWTATGEGDVVVDIEPSSFSLQAGQTQELQISVQPQQQGVFGLWAAGSVVLMPTSGNFSTQRLPIGVLTAAADLPTSIQINASANRGNQTINLSSVVELDEFVARTSPLVVPEKFAPTLIQDPTNRDAFDNIVGTSTELLDVGSGALLLHAQTFTSASKDVDLYVGFDANGDGQPQQSELECESTTPDDLEQCRIETPREGQWWVRVQNWTSSSSGASDQIPFEIAVLEDANDPTLALVGPGNHPGGEMPLELYWDKSGLELDQRVLGAIGLSSSPTIKADIGVVPLELARSATTESLETALFIGRAESVIVPGNASHDRLYVDVPSSATSLQITAIGDLAGLDLRRRAFSELAATVPETPAAPDTVLAEGSQAAGVWTLDFEAGAGETLSPGRYFIVPENVNAAEASVEVSIDIAEAGPISTQRGLWGTINRRFQGAPLDPRQGIDWRKSGNNSVVIWYTYDRSGIPTYYITDAIPEDSGRSVYQSKLFRFTSNNERQSPMVVGEMQLTAVSENQVMFAWRLNGKHGSEMMSLSAAPGCITESGNSLPIRGLWYDVSEDSGGVSLITTNSVEVWTRYYYDKRGEPRWVVTGDADLSPSLEGGKRFRLYEFRGFCPNCTEIDPALEEIGALERTLNESNSPRELLDFTAGSPIDTRVISDRQLSLLTDRVECSIE